MSGNCGSRLRKVALTGALTPGLVLGMVTAVGFGGLSHGLTPADAAAQSAAETQTCAEFQSPTTTSTTPMSTADVAAKDNPAVVSVINYQQLSASDLNGISIQDIPGMPTLPGIDQLPGADQPPNAPDMPAAPSDTIPGAGGDASDSIVPVGTGSGFIIDDSGHVVTNAHVVDGAEKLTVSLFDGTEVPVTLVGKDDLIDVAVLKLDLPSGTKVPGIVAFADSSKLRPGDEVVAIGNALGEFPNTVSDGTVNGVHRSFPGAYGLSAMIQHDAEIWHGNSGGPLLDMQGNVVGINTAGIGSDTLGSDTGSASMGFAIESNIACNAAADLLDDGHIVWPYMGIQGEATEDGQTVTDLVQDGPSDKAGLQVGDVITGLGGQNVDQQHTLLDLLFGHKPGDVVSISVDRNGTPQTFQVTLGERPEMTQ